MAHSKYFVIRSNLNGLVLDIEGGNAGHHTPVAPYDYHGGPNQLWFQDPVNNVIRSKLDENYVLDVEHGSLTVNFFRHGESHQQLRRPTHSEGPITHVESGKVLDIWGGKTEPGAPVKLYNGHGGPNQQWTFEELPQAELFFIRSQANDLILDVKGSDDGPGADVILYEKGNHQQNQMWWEDGFGVIRSKLNNYTLDASSGTLKLQPYDHYNTGSMFARNGPIIANVQDPSMVLDVASYGVISYKHHGGQNQRWAFEFV